MYEHIFGPINSRRLGISLGIDLFDSKICSMNCIYCECGKTTTLTNKFAEYVPTINVINELKDVLDKKPNLDFITFAGKGEPTLHTGFWEITKFIKDNYPQYKVAMITNSSTLMIKEIREKLMIFDLVMPSLDAVTCETFMKMNMPHSEVNLNEIINSLILFSQEFKNTLCLEIFLVPGINDSASEIEMFKKIVQQIRFDKLYINRVHRSTAFKNIPKATDEEIINFANSIGKKADLI